MGRARGARTARGRALRLALMTLARAWPTSLAVASLAMAAGTQSDALAYIDPAVADAREELASRERAASSLRGLDASLTASPSLSYGTAFPGEVTFGGVSYLDAPPAWSGGVYLDATVGYGYDPVALLADRQALVQARAQVAAAERRGVYRALDLHAQLLRLQAAVDEDGVRLAAAIAEVAAAAASSALASFPAAPSAAVSSPAASSRAASSPLAPPAPAAHGGFAVERARLRFADARMRLAEDLRRLRDRRERAAAYGLAPVAGYAPLRFVLPEPDLRRTFAYRLAVLAVERARAAHERERVFGTVQDLEVSASYAAAGVGLGARAGVLDGRPRAELHLTAPGGADGWAVGVSATVVLSAVAGGVPGAARGTARAEKRLTALTRDFPAQARELRAEAAFAEHELALAERRLALAERAQAAGRGAGGSVTASSAGARQRSRLGALEARRSLYDAWARYLAGVAAYLDLVEAPWRAREP